MKYHLSQMATMVNGELCGGGSLVIAQLLIDSRAFFLPSNTLFFALCGHRHDGHDYVADLYRQGLRAFVIASNRKDLCLQFPDASFIAVDNPLHALQQLAAQHRRFFLTPVVAITGSNGKTTLKEWMFQALYPEKHIVRSPKSFNSQVGVPLSVWALDDVCDLAIFEAGMSQKGEMERLETIIRPDIGIFTHIGEAHQENFSSVDEKIREKLKLFVHCKTVIFNAGDDRIAQILFHEPLWKGMFLFAWHLFHSEEEFEKYSSNPLALSGVLLPDHGDAQRIRLNYQGKSFEVTCKWTDKGSIENLMHLVAFMLLSGYSGEVIAQRVQTLMPIAMRLEVKRGIGSCTLINDSYNADLESLSIALDLLCRQHQHDTRTLILSDILQSGKAEGELYAEVAELVKSQGVDRVMGIGPAISKHRDLFRLQDTFYESTDAFLQAYHKLRFEREAILLKGARPFEFERISRLLEGKSHETVLEVNLNAMVHNFNYFKSLLHQRTKMVVMAKAFTYGSGTVQIANLLQFHRVDYLAVAFVDEGVALRDNGITVPIMVMNPEMNSLRQMVEHHLEPEVFSFAALKLLSETLQTQQISKYPIHIKLDTGMHRLGFQPHEIADLITLLLQCPQVKVQSAFSHLAGSDEAAFDDFTREQIHKFTAMTEQLKQGLGYPFLRHILNSAGIERFPESQFDMVRLGIGLHGISAVDNARLQPVVSLKSVILQIKEIVPGETVGYSRRFKASECVRYGVVPMGYADGLRRELGNGNGYVVVNQCKAPIIGNICMDMCMIDVTHIDAKEGDVVTLLGEHPSVVEIADMLHTIPYEVLTGISSRVKRIYYEE